MKIQNLFLILSFVAALPCAQQVNADEGFGAGNGGGVYYCPGQTPEVMLIDLRESERARQIYDQLRASGKDTFQLLQDAFRQNRWMNLDWPGLTDEIEYVHRELSRPENAVPADEELLYPAEAFPPSRPVGCMFRAVVSYQRDQRILYDRLLLDRVKADPVQYAGLLLHEALYRHARDQSEVAHSLDVRPFVSEILNGSGSSQISPNSMGLFLAVSESTERMARTRLWRTFHRDEAGRPRIRILYYSNGGAINPRCNVSFRIMNRHGEAVDEGRFHVEVHTRSRMDENGLAVSRGPEFHHWRNLSTEMYRTAWGRFETRYSADDFIDLYPELTVRDIKQGRFRLEVSQDCSRRAYVGMNVELVIHQDVYGSVPQNSGTGTRSFFRIEQNIPESLQIELR